MFHLLRRSYDFVRQSFSEHLIDPWTLAAIGSTAFIVIIYSKRKEAILLSEMESREDLINPSDSSSLCNEHKNKPCNYAMWIDRPSQYEQLYNYIKSPTARVIVLVGIPQSGRSKLATKAVLEAYSNDITHLDVRNSPFDDVNGLENRFTNKSFDFSDAISSFISGLSKTIRGELDALEEATHDKNHTDEQEAVESLNRFKGSLRRFKYVVLPEDKPHLLFINHMEAFTAITRDKTGMRALEYFLLWLLNLTRDKRNIRVVLTCTPLFFYDWLLDYPYRDNIHIIGLGDLSKNQAEHAYNQFLKSIVRNEEKIERAPKFENIYEQVGGRIHDLSKFVEMYSASPIQTLEQHPELGSLITKCTQVLYPQYFSQTTRNQVSYPVLWTREHIISTWKILLNAQDNAVCYSDFISQIPMDVFYSMFRHGIVTFRPQSVSYEDYEICKTTDTVMFRRPLEKYAASIVLSKLSQQEEEEEKL